MPVTLPTVFGGAQALYPLVMRVSFDTGVTINCDMSEQRWKKGPPLFSFTWQYSLIDTADLGSFLTFFNSELGAFATNWSFVLGSATYANMALDFDTFTAIERNDKLYGFSIQAGQTQNKSYAIPSVSGDFPQWNNSTAVGIQKPYQRSIRLMTSTGRSQGGYRYNFAWWANGQTNMPASSLHRWQLQYPVLSDAQAAAMLQFFLGKQGRLTSFTFTDFDTSTAYTTVRFDQDTLEVRYNGPNSTSMQMNLVENVGG